MELLFSLFGIIFIGLLLATAFTFSLAFIVILSAVMVGLIAWTVLKDKLRRWGMMRNAPEKKQRNITIIEGQYKEIDE